MKDFEKSAKNIFLFFVAFALFALPVFVYMNLVPVVDSSLSQNSITNQNISNKEKNYDEVIDEKAQIVQKEQNEQKVLGALSDGYFGVEAFYELNTVKNEEKLINNEKSFFSVITLSSDIISQSKIFDIYLIKDNPKYTSLSLEFGLIEEEFRGLVINSVINDKKYKIFDGSKLMKDSLIKLNPTEMLVLGFEIEGESIFPEKDKNISIKLDRL